MDIRIDKWLWAARFYKTRTIARDMINGGKVHYNNQRVKPSKIVEVNATIELWQGFNKIEVKVLALSDERQKYEIAKLLYQETENSIKRRQENEIAYKQSALYSPHPIDKPNKKQRRAIEDFKQTFFN